MASASTIYDIRVKYMLDDKASRALGNIGKRADLAARSVKRTSGLLSGLSRTLVGFGIGYGFTRLIKGAINYNRELDNTRLSLGAVLQQTIGLSRPDAISAAAKLLNDFKKDAESTAGTFQELAEIGSQIAPAIGGAGGTVKDIRELAKLTSVAASAFKVRKDVAALDIRQALTKGVSARDPLTSMLGLTPDVFNKLSKAARLDELKKALDTQAIRDAAVAFENSFEGRFSTFESQLQEAIGMIGGPLFGVLTDVLGEVTAWMRQNEAHIAQFAKDVGQGLVRAFEIAREVFGFLVEHAGLLKALAAGFVLKKVSTGLQSMGEAFTAFRSGLTQTGTGFTGLIGKLGTVSMVLGGVAIAAQAFVDFANKRLENRQKAQGDIAYALDRADEARKRFLNTRRTSGSKAGIYGSETEKYEQQQNYRQLLTNARQIGILKGSDIQYNKIRTIADRADYGPSRAQHLIDELTNAIKLSTEGRLGQSLAINPAQAPKSSETGTPRNQGNVTNVDRVVVNVTSDDPDRFAIGLEELFTDLSKSGAQAAAALGEGL